VYDLEALDSAFAQSIYSGKFHYTATTASTNTDALAAAREGAPHGSVFFSDEQTAGRGRGDHGWQSAAGQGLYVSVILRPSIDAQHMPHVSRRFRRPDPRHYARNCDQPHWRPTPAS